MDNDSTADLAALGALIRSARQAHGLTTRQLAEMVGWHQSRLVHLEQGAVARPSALLLQRIAQQLEIPLLELYRLAGVPIPALRPYLRAYGLSPEDTAKAEAYIARLAAEAGSTGPGPLDGLDEQPEEK
jgi:transcriptional regulator with XRE-family HTH domain